MHEHQPVPHTFRHVHQHQPEGRELHREGPAPAQRHGRPDPALLGDDQRGELASHGNLSLAAQPQEGQGGQLMAQTLRP